MKKQTTLLGALALLTTAANAGAVTSAEIYTNAAYQYGRFSARIQFAPGSGVVSSFFLWKDGSEMSDVFWNELDFEKLEGECRLETNTIYGDGPGLDPERHVLGDLCASYHVYTYEWTPEYIAWSVDGTEIRRETGEAAVAFRDNTADGMQLRFNVWPGDASFGGEFDPAILPVYQYIDWVEYSSYSNGAFQVEWREDFTAGTLPSGWLTGSWPSPKENSTHARTNLGIIDGYMVLALTADDATGIAGANPSATDTNPGPQPEPTGSGTEPVTPGPTEPVTPGTGTEPVTPVGPTPNPDGSTPVPEPTAPVNPTPVAPSPVSPSSEPVSPGPGPTPTDGTGNPAPSGSGDPSQTSSGSDDASGCGCKVGATAPASSSTAGFLAALMATVGWLGRRRRGN